MPTILRTENDTVLQGQSFQKLLMADAGKKFHSIKVRGQNEIFTNNKEHIVTIPADNDDAEIIVCQVDDVAPPPATFTVRVEFNSVCSFQKGYGGQLWNGASVPGFVQFTYTAGETFTGIFGIVPADASQYELSHIVVAQEGMAFLPNVAGMMSYVHTRIIDKNLTFIVYSRLKVATPSFTVTTSVVGGNGTVTPASQVVLSGGNAHATITPASGYRIKSITINNQPLTTPYNRAGGPFVFPAIYANTSIVVIFELISTAPADALNAVITWYLWDRLVGSATEALQYDRSSFLNVNITDRVHKKNGNIISGFTLPYNYTGDLLRLETTWDVGYTTIDEFYDSLNSNYLRLAIHTVGKDGNTLKITTRLNNSYANAGAGFQPSQVTFCRMKVTRPDSVVLTYNHPILYGITDLTHTVPLTIVGVYTIETETILAGSNLRTSYSKTFAELSIP